MVEAEQLEHVGGEEVLDQHEGQVARREEEDGELQPRAGHLLVVRTERLPDQRVEHLVEGERRHDQDVDHHVGERRRGEVLLPGVRAVKEKTPVVALVRWPTKAVSVEAMPIRHTKPTMGQPSMNIVL